MRDVTDFRYSRYMRDVPDLRYSRYTSLDIWEMLQTLDIPETLDNYINLKSSLNLFKKSRNKFYVNSVRTKIGA